jgi:hypothetical protein
MTTGKDDDITKLKNALAKEREERKAATTALKAAQSKLAEIEQATALGESPNASKVSEFIAASVAARVAAETADLQKKVGTLESQLSDAATARATVESKLAHRTIDDAVRAAAAEAHVKPEALADVLTIAGLEMKLNDTGEVLTPDGQDVHQWLDARKATSPHWWPVARGGGARGSDGGAPPTLDNPFQPGSSFSLTKQGQLMRESPAMASRLQAEAAAMPRG